MVVIYMNACHIDAEGRIQSISDHLHGVAKYCEEYASAFGAEELAYTIGLLHDIGKYSAAFQNRILNNGDKVDHATAGGIEISRLCGLLGAYCVMGHHGGLPNGGSGSDSSGEPTLRGRLKRRIGKEIHDYSSFINEIKPTAPKEPLFKPIGNYGFSYAMMIRMLFSCLVDADFIDTEKFMSNGQIQRGGYNSIPDLLQKLMNHLDSFSAPTSDINKKRNGILQDCKVKAYEQKGLYSLTVPTGGGKTLSSLAFALTHAKEHSMDRIIYVIPYTSIIEQNAKVFSDILGRENVLEHHSGFEYDNEDDEQNKLYLSTENWDAPVVVTTNVQFFESLFASKTSKCRKIHNIANSVIIFDEAQMLPTPYLLACTRTIAELVHNFGCTAVLCSATQPSLDPFFPLEIKRTEICKDPVGLYNFFKRVNIKTIGTLTDDELIQRINGFEQVLCIVNTRKQAQNLYNRLDEKGTYHLSTLMYPEHRKNILEHIKLLLHNGEPCRVIATSLVEAGVDVDFPVVFRASAGLDSIVQAAGRCNREGRRSIDDSFTYVFHPDESYKLPVSWRQPAEITKIIESNYPNDIATLNAIHEYFEKLYDIKGEMLDAQKIVSQLEDGYKNGGSFPFRSISEQFKLIDNKTHSILIPITREGAEIVKRLRDGERNRKLMRQAGRYCVNAYDNHFIELRQLGIIECLDTEIAVLTDISSYSHKTGLTLTPEGGKGLFL